MKLSMREKELIRAALSYALDQAPVIHNSRRSAEYSAVRKRFDEAVRQPIEGKYEPE